MLKNIFITYLLLSFFCLMNVNAQNILQIKEEKFLKLDSHLQVLEDSAKSWTIEQVTSSDFSKKFDDTPFHTVSFGLSTSEYWARVVLSAEKPTQYWLEFANPTLLQASIFYFDSLQRQWIELKKDLINHNTKATLQLLTTVFPIELSPIPKTFYLKFGNTAPLNVPVILWQAQKFTETQNNLSLFLGLFFGVIAVMLLYNFLMYWLVKEYSFLLYSILIFFEGLGHIVISGFFFQYIFQYLDGEGALLVSQLIFPLTGLAKVIFVMYFLQVRQHSTALFKWLLFTIFLKCLLIVFAVGSLLSLFMIGVFVFGLIANCSYLYIGIRLTKTLKSSAVFFVIATAIHLLGTVAFFVQGLNIWQLDYISYTYTSHILGIFAYGFEIIFVSVALSNRVNLMKAEITQKEYEKKLIAQEEALKLKYEKDRISKDLHDNIGSQLTYLAKNLEKLKQQPETENTKIDNLTDMTQNIVQDLRNMIWVINKEEISIQDLEDKLTNLVWKTIGQMEGVYGEVKANFEKEINLNASQALNLFRIAQEALQNAIKYSKAQNIEIQLYTNQSGQLSLQIKDDGIGFDLAQSKLLKGHYGLKNMESRAEEIGGIFQVETAIGKGTRVKVQL